jgi:hypothetical protein
MFMSPMNIDRWIGRNGFHLFDWLPKVRCETVMCLVAASATHELQYGQEEINCIEIDGK